MRLRGRGRLSSVDLLPDWAEQAVVSALAKLRENKQPQIEILEEFNAELRALAFAAGVMDPPQISASAFNRRTMRLAAHGRRLAETREIASVIASKMEDGADEDVTLLLAETIKTIVFEMLERAEGLTASASSAEMMANMSVALANAERAKKISADMKLLVERNFKKSADEAIDRVATAKGLTPDTVREFKRVLYGVRDARA
jgi:hypothetical protein